MINTLTLSHRSFPVNLIQGPLAGVSTAPFRALTAHYMQPAFSCTEMVSCHTIIHQSEFAYHRFIKKHEKEGALCVQLSSSDPLQLAEATKRVTDYGVESIDLNCGCPVNKIRKKGAGSRLLTDARKIYTLIRAMKNNTHLPVSIKIRVQGSSNDRFHRDLANAINDAELDFLIVHGRHWTENYETPCHYNDIAYFVEEINKPVIGNGDIHSIDSLKKMFATGCQGVMIARASVGQPWLFNQLYAAMQGESFTSPSPQEIGRLFIWHIEELATLLGNEKMAVLHARKLGKYYARSLHNKTHFIKAITLCDCVDALKRIITDFFVS